MVYLLWFLSTEKAVGEGKEAQALLRTQMSTLEADRQKASSGTVCVMLPRVYIEAVYVTIEGLRTRMV